MCSFGKTINLCSPGFQALGIESEKNSFPARFERAYLWRLLPIAIGLAIHSLAQLQRTQSNKALGDLNYAGDPGVADNNVFEGPETQA